MKCKYCGGTGKQKSPNNQKDFEDFIEREMDKGYFVNFSMARDKAYKAVGYKVITCPYCNVEKNKPE